MSKNVILTDSYILDLMARLPRNWFVRELQNNIPTRQMVFPCWAQSRVLTHVHTRRLRRSSRRLPALPSAAPADASHPFLLTRTTRHIFICSYSHTPCWRWKTTWSTSCSGWVTPQSGLFHQNSQSQLSEWDDPTERCLFIVFIALVIFCFATNYWDLSCKAASYSGRIWDSTWLTVM